MAEVIANSSVPMYRQLANLIRERVRRGELERGARVPSEAELCGAYSVSRITVRHALSELERENLLERIPGKGTFVRRDTGRVERLTRLSGFGENASGLGLVAGYETLRAEEGKVPLEVSERLGTPRGRAFVVERVLLADGRPIGAHLSYLPMRIVEGAAGAFSRRSLDRGSLYAAIEGAGGVLHRADEIVEPALAGAEDAEKLGVEEGDLLLRVTRTVYDPDGRPLEHVIITYVSDAYTFRQRLFRDRG